MSIKSLIYLLLEKFLSQFTDKIVCISKAERNSAIKRRIANRDKLVLIPNGIDILAVQKAVSKSREELGIDVNSYVIGMVGRISPQKAPDVFIQAAKLIQYKIPHAVFIIVGDGEEADSIVLYAKRNNIKLIVTGWVDNPYSYLKVFDVALLLSRWEGFGLAIIEYMAANKNVVATNVDAIPTLIEDGVDGLLVDVDNPEDVMTKVVYVYEHPVEAERMRKKAYDKVLANYSIDRVVEQHLLMFQELIAKR